MKSCASCKNEKELEYFSKDKKRLDGLYVYCKKCVKEKSKIRYENNKEEINKKTKKWKQDNKESYLAQQREYKKEYIKTPNHKYREYRLGAEERDYPFELTFEDFMTYWQKPCFYCDEEINTIGIDRVDNTLGYIEGNMVPCCSICNRSKDIFTAQEFISRCERIVENCKNKIL